METTPEIQKPEKKNKAWRIIKKILLTIVILFLLLIGTAVTILYFYEDSIKKIIVDNINKQLNTEIQVKEIDLTLFKKFPNVSLVFTDVIAKDAIKSTNKGNLLKAKNVYLQFSFWDLWYKNYKIKKIEAENGIINIVTYKDGSVNYHFWKNDTTAKSESFSFDLQKVILKNMAIRYCDFKLNQNYMGATNNLVLSGKFSSDKFTMFANGNMLMNYVNISGIKFIPGKNINISLKLDVDQSTDVYKFTDSKLLMGNMSFDVNGNVINSENKGFVNLSVTGAKTELQSFIKELPYEYRKYFEKYKVEGDFYFNTNIKGSYLGESFPGVKVSFGIKNGNIILKESDIALKNVNMSGTYSSGASSSLVNSELNINNFSSTLKSGNIKGNIKIKNFLKPEIEMLVDANMDLQEMQEFLKVDTITSLKGKVNMSASFKGKVNSEKGFEVKDFIASNAEGKLTVTGGELSIKNDPRNYKNIEGKFEFSNNDIIVNELNMLINQSDFKLKGYFKNLLSFIFLDDQKLLIDANLVSEKTELDDLLQYGTSSDTSYRLVFPEKIECKLDIDINKLTFRKFTATNISGKVKLKNKQLHADPLEFNSVDGSVDGEVLVDGSQKGQLLISCEAELKDMNIKKLFYEFGNFGQNSMKDENLEGTATADVRFAGVWSDYLKPVMDKMYAKSDIVIEKGRLLNYAPMQGLSRFLKMSDLNDVKFSTLHNQIEIKNRTIHIPAMEIKSSAIDIIASGEHTFDNVINYHIQVKLSDIMAQKAKKAKPENEEFGVVEDDGLGKTSLFILVTGTVDNPVYKYDGKGVKAKIVVNYVKEKENLKSILNEEFGWFKKDSAVIKNKEENKNKPELKPKKNKNESNLEKQENGNFVIEWDEDSPGKGD
ncbi:MAG TPA: AsmA-like C-terminal region-containing protein [Bacteroidales bacterium]|nr:AsmA-like C-terminal region-containing protein [Bacteroidales bacterium]HPS16620.1 AsmA-like C-terminal region-containing protein [Bacteroidales bacterium]